MPKSILETLEELRNNSTTALAQLIAILSEMCKQHELQTKNFAAQLRQPFTLQSYVASTRLSPVRRQRQILPDVGSSFRTREIQSRTAYIHEELAVLDNIVLDQLSDVQISDEDDNELRNEEFMSPDEELETQQLLLSAGDTVRAGEDVRNLEDRIEQLEIDEQSITMTGFKAAGANSLKKSKERQRNGLQFDQQIKIKLQPRNAVFKVLEQDVEEQALETGGARKLAEYEEKVLALFTEPQEQSGMQASEMLESALPDMMNMTTSALDLMLPNSPTEKYENDFLLSEKIGSERVQCFIEVLSRYHEGEVELEELEGDVRVRQL